ncbi:hypothetical protein [Kitasatospora sp. NPDC085464]|uniref:hypothetical protein n=1 Tax=Kitasatospora sp. NPDC085464 TaxID=3364063 RepID=UPI0037CB28ED
MMESQCGPRETGDPADPANGDVRDERDERGVGVDGANPVDPGEHTVQWVYQPVEVDLGEGAWALGRISGWWQDATGRRWCRLRVGRSGQPAYWERFDPARVVLLPVSGL